MESFSIYEVIMLICFGCSWPFAIVKTLRVKNPTGKSYLFMTLILVGYVAGGLHKIFYHFDGVFWLYLLNFVLVSLDFGFSLYYQARINRQARLEARHGQN